MLRGNGVVDSTGNSSSSSINRQTRLGSGAIPLKDFSEKKTKKAKTTSSRAVAAAGGKDKERQRNGRYSQGHSIPTIL
jgi:hypothetical protein